MKKTIAVFMSFIILLSCAACLNSSSDVSENNLTTSNEATTEKTQSVSSEWSQTDKSSSNSKMNGHTCEECGREGVYRYKSFTGKTEYYCAKHYKELKDMLDSFGLD